MKPTNYAEKIRRRKQFLKQNKIKPVAPPKKKLAVWIWRIAWILISFIAVVLMAVFSFMLFFSAELREEWLSYQNIMVLISLVVIALSLAMIWIGPKIYVRTLKSKPLNGNQSDFDREKEKLKLEDDTRKTFAQLVGGAVFLFGLLFTYNTFVLNREGQITDRFTKAVEQLGKDDIAVRLGGLYALERITKDSPKDHWTIIEILSSYIREKAPNKKPANPAEIDQKTQSNSAPNKKPANAAEIDQKTQSNSTEAKQAENEAIKTDVQAALTIIGRRLSKQDPTTFSTINLSNVNLRGAHIYEADLKNANLNRANLNGAKCFRANLTNAALNQTNLSGADLRSVHLNSAVLTGAYLSGANFSDATLDGADLRGADLSGAFNLTYEQIVTAIISEETMLPKYLESRRQELLDISRRYLESRRQESLEEYKRYQELKKKFDP